MMMHLQASFGFLFVLSMPLLLRAAEAPQEPATKSGFSTAPHLEGGDGVQADLAEDDVDVGSVFRPPLLDGVLDPWWKFKRKLNDKLGLQLQFSYQALYQNAGVNLAEDEAAAGRAEAQGMWTLLGRNTKNTGQLSFRIEDRHRLGTDIPPTRLGGQFGSAGLTGTGFSDFELALTEMAWRQAVADGRVKFGFGKISAQSWYNVHALSSSKKGFQDSALQSSAAKPTVGRGIGAVVGSRLGDSFAVIAGIHDANAVTSKNPFDTIDEAEFYESIEFRWFLTTFERNKWDQVRLQVWHQDEREQAGVPSSQGATFAVSKLFNDFYMPFLLGGLSDGDASTMEADLTAGIGLGFNTKHRAARDVLGLAVNWGNPSDGTLRDQYTTELFYRFQLFQNIAFTPSVQYIVDPATDRGEDEVWVGSIRARATF